jgi:hypothetical protein
VVGRRRRWDGGKTEFGGQNSKSKSESSRRKGQIKIKGKNQKSKMLGCTVELGREGWWRSELFFDFCLLIFDLIFSEPLSC